MNNGDGTFSQVQATSNFDAYRGSGSGRASFGSMPRDFDNDGDIDFFEILTHGYGDGASGIHSTAVANVDGSSGGTHEEGAPTYGHAEIILGDCAQKRQAEDAQEDPERSQSAFRCASFHD